MFGRGQKEEMLASLEPYWPEASFRVYAAAVAAAAQGKPHFATETRLSSIDGRDFDVWFTACYPPEMVARGKLLIGIVDISAAKKPKTAVEVSASNPARTKQAKNSTTQEAIVRDRCARISRMSTSGIKAIAKNTATTNGISTVRSQSSIKPTATTVRIERQIV